MVNTIEHAGARRHKRGRSSLHILPEVVRVEEAREFGIDVDNVNIAFAAVADDCFLVVTILVSLEVDTQGPIDFQTESK